MSCELVYVYSLGAGFSIAVTMKFLFLFVLFLFGCCAVAWCPFMCSFFFFFSRIYMLNNFGRERWVEMLAGLFLKESYRWDDN